MSQANVSALFLFNHKYERNVEKLEALYADRFPIRKYLMPFADRPDARVLRVYELSWNFSGHIAQAAPGYIDPAISHYAFIADDLVLNPTLDGAGLVAALGLDARSGYIKSLASADSLRFRWAWSGESAMSLRKFGRGFDYKAELPPAAEARARFEALGVEFPRPLPRSAKDVIYNFVKLPRKAPWAFAMGLGTFGARAEYPLLAGYADLVVVPACAIERFVHYCGVFAAMNLFAEVAVPTALALACDRVVTELPINAHFYNEPRRNPELALRGVEFWDPAEAEGFAARMGSDLARLRAEFPRDWLYAHPVKLSRWA